MPEVLYRDPRLAVLDKPADVSLLADRSGAPCLWETLPGLLGTKPYLVHRLDKGTSGVLLVALDADMQRTLTRAFQRRQVRKYYLTWVSGRLEGEGTRVIDLPLRKGRKSRYRVAGPREHIRASGRGWVLAAADGAGFVSVTRLRSLTTAPGRSLLLAQPLTGRTHQIRVHLAWVGHPILGDHLYGRPSSPEQQAPRLQLHCHRLAVPGVGTFSVRPREGWLAGEPRVAPSGCGKS